MSYHLSAAPCCACRARARPPPATPVRGSREGRSSVFTDDDTVPSPTWVGAAIDYLDTHPEAVGVAGPIRSTSWDPLYEQSLEAPIAGHYWTCNIAYRRSVFEAIGGFRADIFTYAHAEDRDLAVRALSVGELGFAEGMEVSHTPRRFGLRDVARQSRWVRDDLALYALHPQLTTSFTLPVRLALVSGAARRWLACCLPGDTPPSLTRTRRALLFAIVSMATTAWTVVRTPSARVLRKRGNPHAG